MVKQGVRLVALLLVLIVVLSPAPAGQEKHDGGKGDMDHVIVTPGQEKWGPAPPSLPPGAQIAILFGAPTKPGEAYALRVKMPDGYRVAPHWHPVDENVTVIQGVLGMGQGEKFDRRSGKELPAGSFSHMPKGMRHFAWTKGETIIQLNGVGPFEINYVDAADDPRNSPKKSR
jgi:hypothetical protein